MSWGLKLLASFPALGAGATYSFVAVSNGKNKVIAPQEIPVPIAPPVVKVEEINHPVPEPEPEPAPSVQEVMKEIMEEKNYLGCGLLSGFRDLKVIWYVCSSKDGLNIPTFYNYAKSRPSNSRNRQVTSLSSKKKTVRFTEGSPESLKLPPFWMGKFGGKDLEPEKNCRFEQRGQSKTSYNLKCHDYVIPNSIEF